MSLGGNFADEEQRLSAQIATLEAETVSIADEEKRRNELADRFDEVTELLASLDLVAIWEEAIPAERRTLVEDLVDSVYSYPDQITVQVAGALPILVTLNEVGLRVASRPVVSAARLLIGLVGAPHKRVGGQARRLEQSRLQKIPHISKC